MESAPAEKEGAPWRTWHVLPVATKTSWKDTNGNGQFENARHAIVWKQIFAQYASRLRNSAGVLVEGGLRCGGYVGVVHRFYRHQADSIVELDRPERSDLPADRQPVSEVLPA